jgi:hypothetical protein
VVLRFFRGFFFRASSARAASSSGTGDDGGEDPAPREPELETGDALRSIVLYDLIGYSCVVQQSNS